MADPIPWLRALSAARVAIARLELVSKRKVRKRIIVLNAVEAERVLALLTERRWCDTNAVDLELIERLLRALVERRT